MEIVDVLYDEEEYIYNMDHYKPEEHDRVIKEELKLIRN
jgi:hypothetical protein